MMKSFEIPEATSDYLQRLAFEKMAREDVIDRILTSHRDDADSSVVDGEPFKRYMRDLVEVSAEYEKAKESLPALFPDGVDRAAPWSLDFDTHVVTVDA